MTEHDPHTSSSTRSRAETGASPARYLVLAVAAALLFFAGYAFVTSRGAPVATSVPVETISSTNASGGAQRVSVDVSRGYFDPSVIKARAGEPIRIQFGQGAGCMSAVRFEAFGIEKDLTNGGAVVDLPALARGRYEFSCGMAMVFGTLVVE